MARKPRMGRNLNALLNSAVKERREQQSADAPLASEDGGAAAAVATEPPPLRPRTERQAARALDAVRVEAPPSRPAPADATEEVDIGLPPAEVPGARDGASEPGGPGGPGETEREEVPAPPPDALPGDLAVEPSPIDPDGIASADPPRPGDRLRMIGVERIRRGVFQPRRFFDQEALQELADSLKSQGMIQPVIVRPFGNAFELIAGERRWRAAQIAGLTEIPAIVREMEDRTVAAVSLIENIQREDLNPLEEAQALTRLCDEFGMTHASVAESIGRSRASVSNLMRLLELHDEVKVLVDKGELDMGHARALLRVPKVDQPALAARVAKQGLTVRAVEKLIRTGADKSAAAAPVQAPDPDVERLVERLSSVLGAPVAIRHKPGGSGRLEIRYTSLEELDGIIAHIK